tara:strand:- start:216 stop:1364 length:1149 start_codon:yes stop_codon:yes gene_type:complete
MSEIKVNSIKGVGATDAAITVNNSDGTCTANLSNRQGKNLVVNGACLIAQRGLSSTTNGYGSVDRFSVGYGGTDEAPTQAQVDVASGTTPYTLGFRKALRITNGNQTSGAGSADFLGIEYHVEAQDMANSGWNYTSSSSNVTLSFWIKSSVAQSFKGFLRSRDGTSQRYAFDTGSLTQDTWTKITKTIPGSSNLQFDNDNDKGLLIVLAGFYGTDYTDNSITENAWAAYAASTRMKDNTSTWYTTNDATLEITGVQLEVSDHASDFEFLSFADELRRCQRYYQVVAEGENHIIGSVFTVSSYIYSVVDLSVTMRATPTVEVSNFTNAFRAYGTSGGVNVNTLSITGESRNNRIFIEQAGNPGTVASLRCYNANSKLALSAEL